MLVLDGHSLAFRAFYALQAESFTTPTGQYTNAVYGFTTTLLKLMGDYKPELVAVAFDLPGGTFRTRKFPEYKGGRAPIPQEFKGQIELIQTTLDVLGIAWVTVEDFEADDIVATLAKKAQVAGNHVFISSGDKDAYQLVTEKCTLLYPMPRSQMQVLTPEGVENKTGLSPERYPDMAALVGEGADNLPGVPGVGPKTALKWLNQFGSLEGIIERGDELTGKVGQSLRDHSDQARLNRTLNRLVDDLPIGDDLTEFEIRGVDRNGLHELFDTLDFTGLRKRVLQELPARPGEGNTDESAVVVVELEISDEKLETWLAGRTSATWGLAVKGSYSPGRGGVDACAIADETNHAVIVDPAELDPQDEVALAAWLECEAVSIVCHGAKDIWHAFQGAGGFNLRGVTYDTLLAAYLLHPDQREYLFSDLALRHLGVELDESEDAGLLPGLGAGNRDLAQQASLCIPLGQALAKELADQGEDGALMALELAVSETLETMESIGIAVDEPYLATLHASFDERVNQAIAAAHAAIGREINLSSPKQLSALLFDELQLPPTKKIRSGYTTNADALADLAQRIAGREDEAGVAGQEFLGALLEHRDAIKLRQAVEGLERSILSDGRIHTTYQQAVAATGRLSSTDPNLQNIHARTEEGLQIRSAFVASTGFESLMTADYSQIEMRLMASLSGDQLLINAFNAGADLHTYVASRVFDIPEESVTSSQRSKIKAMSYGLAYGLSAFGLSKQLHLGVGEAQRLMDDYFSIFGNVRAYLDSLVERARKDGYTATILGRRRNLPELTSTNRQLREAAERMALNAPIQGSAADIIKLAMVAVVADLKQASLKSRVLLQVHDELILEIAPGEQAQVEEIVRRDMAGAAELDVPLSVGIGVGPNWRAAAH